ncbi:MAG: hypothetical protein JW765_11580 [Deltaproteobacteria bacterium]|nr:hypothetical protein [Candidatus Zymogenaceae bacterium]
MRSVSDRRGKSRLGMLLIVAVVAAVIYAVIQFVPPISDYLKMKNIAYDVMNSIGDKGDNQILDRLFNMTKKAGIEITPENVVIEREESRPVVLVIDYSKTVVLIKDKLEKTLNFHIEETAR